MPEGHTIHLIARDHTRAFVGEHVTVTSPQGRFVEGAALLDGHLLLQIKAHGKHLFYHWQDAPLLHVHLGLIGRFTLRRLPPPDPGPSVRLRLLSSKAVADLVGATTCEILTPEERQRIVDRLGPDPLRRDADPNLAWERLKRRHGPVGAVLLDQSILSGVGNVYRAEALFVQGIHPERPASSLSRAEFDELWSTIVSMLRQGMKDRRILTVRREDRAGRRISRLRPGEPAFYVYKQQNCTRCGEPVRSWAMGARQAYACERCQPPAA